MPIVICCISCIIYCSFSPYQSREGSHCYVLNKNIISASGVVPFAYQSSQVADMVTATLTVSEVKARVVARRSPHLDHPPTNLASPIVHPLFRAQLFLSRFHNFPCRNRKGFVIAQLYAHCLESSVAVQPAQPRIMHAGRLHYHSRSKAGPWKSHHAPECPGSDDAKPGMVGKFRVIPAIAR